jgi:hypothetical protein
MKPSELKPFIEGSPAANANVICCICGTKTSWNRAATGGWIADLDGEPYNSYYCLGCPGKIKSAAIQYEGKIWTGKRHPEIIAKMREDGVPREGVAQANQGFVNYRGEFLDRKQALEIAVFHGQVNMANKQGNQTELFSEDLY